MELLSNEDGEKAYRRAHQLRLAIFCVSDAFSVSIDCRFRNAVPPSESLRQGIHRFLAHKAFVRRVSRAADADGAIRDFCNWSGSVQCEGAPDPRCLPFFLFASNLSACLAHKDCREAFVRTHGPASRREDVASWVWKAPGRNLHGRIELAVAGCVLPRGYHWDVEPPRRGIWIRTPTKQLRVWEYVNVYPDGYLREGK